MQLFSEKGEMKFAPVQLLARNDALRGLCDVTWGLVPRDLCFSAHILRSGEDERGKTLLREVRSEGSDIFFLPLENITAVDFA